MNVRDLYDIIKDLANEVDTVKSSLAQKVSTTDITNLLNNISTQLSTLTNTVSSFSDKINNLAVRVEQVERNIGAYSYSLNELTDVNTTDVTTGDLLVYDGEEWIDRHPSDIGITSTLDELTDVEINSPGTGEILFYNGTEWVNATKDEADIAPEDHEHTASDITDFDVEVSNNTDVSANTTHRTRTDNPHNVTAHQIGLDSTDDLAEGSANLYYTDARVSSNPDVSANTNHRSRTDNPHGVTAAQVGINSTDDIAEGSTNLYYTEARVSANADVSANSTHRVATGNPHNTALDDITDVNAPSPADGEVLTWDDATGKWISAGTGVVTDHGLLTGLLDDDHEQYSLVDGTRAFTGPVGGVDPTDASHLSTKGYVDAGLTGKADTVHTHTASDVTDFDTEVSNNSDVSANTAHRGRTDNPHSVTAAQVGINSTDDITEGSTHLYYTDARVSANANVSANTAHRSTTGNPHGAVLDDINDVNASTPSDGDILVWNGGEWVNTVHIHTASDISDFDTEVSNNTDVSANTTHRSRTDNPHNVTASQVGLNSTDDLDEGSSNLYYTDERVSSNTDVAVNTAHRNTTGNPHDTTYGDIPLEIVEMTISSGDGAVPVPLSANGKILSVQVTTATSSDYLELPDLSTVPDGWHCQIVRRPDSGNGRSLTIKPHAGNTVNSTSTVTLQITNPILSGFNVGNSSEGIFIIKRTNTDWFAQQIGQFWNSYHGCFNIQSLGDTGIYLWSRSNQNTYFQARGAGMRGQLRWTSGYNTYIEPNAQYGDVGVKIDRMTATGGTHGMHLAVGDVAPGGSGGYRVFVIGNGTAPSAAPSSGAQMWAESGVLKVQPQDGNTFSLGNGGFTYPGTAQINGKVGIGKTPDNNWQLSVQGSWPLQLKDSSGIITVEQYADEKQFRFLNGNVLQGYLQDLELNVHDGTSIHQGLVIDETTGNVSIPHDLLVSGTLTNAEVQANTSARHSHSNKTILDAITDAGSGSIITAAERSDIANNTTHRGRTDNPHNVTASQVGLNSTDDLAEGTTNLYYTDSRVSANSDVSANTTHRNTTGNPHSTTLNDITDVNAGSPSDGDVLTWDASTSRWINSSGGGGVTDHGALTGLEDDDHPQYFLADGSRMLEGMFTQQMPSTSSYDETISDERVYNTSSSNFLMFYKNFSINRTGTSTFDTALRRYYYVYRSSSAPPNIYYTQICDQLMNYGSPVTTMLQEIYAVSIAGGNGVGFRVDGYGTNPKLINAMPNTAKVSINLNTPSYTLDVGGDINTSSGYRVSGTAGASGTINLSSVTSITVSGGIITGWS